MEAKFPLLGRNGNGRKNKSTASAPPASSHLNLEPKFGTKSSLGKRQTDEQTGASPKGSSTKPTKETAADAATHPDPDADESSRRSSCSLGFKEQASGAAAEEPAADPEAVVSSVRNHCSKLLSVAQSLSTKVATASAELLRPSNSTQPCQDSLAGVVRLLASLAYFGPELAFQMRELFDMPALAKQNSFYDKKAQSVAFRKQINDTLGDSAAVLLDIMTGLHNPASA
jgi:hypothetical protein